MTKVPPVTQFDERWFSTALRSIGDAVIATDGEGRVLLMNPLAQALTGWSEADAVGRPLVEVFNIVNESTRLPVQSPVEVVLREGHVVGLANHTILVSRNNTDTPIDDSAAPITDEAGNIIGVVLVFRDIAEKRRLEVMKERLAAIVESSDDVIVSKTLDGIITTWNRGAERILGYTEAEAIGNHVSMLMPPETIEDTEKILSRVRLGEKVDHYETKRRRKDGAIIDISVTVSPIRNVEGEIIGASKVGRDITIQKRVEAERLEADRRKDEFLAMLAHELRNPLASINSAVQLFGKLASDNDVVWAKDVVQRQVKHLARLIDDLLDASRITRGKISLRKEDVDIPSVLGRAVEMVRPLVEQREHQLDVSFAPDALAVDADPLRLEQIVGNLLTNAAKYTDPGGHIWLVVTREADEIVIKVKDTGVGISSELLPRVFDLFVQGDRSIDRSEGGLGIGLTLAQKLAEMHGGSLTAESAGVGKGSELTVRLPAATNPVAEATAPTADRGSEAGNGSRVLVIEDNQDSAAGLAMLLKLFHYDVQVAYDGKAAMEIARSQRPDIVLVDIGLPGMDGYEVAKALRTEPWCKDTIIIAISGYGQAEDRRRSKEAGCDHHLVKPIEYDSLMDLLARVEVSHSGGADNEPLTKRPAPTHGNRTQS